jgi:DNA segregation ATPase FtsK/SpoIIIE, S-DNA-T family
MYTGQKRFWPKAVSIELRRLPWRLLGFGLAALAGALLLALLSWSFADPGPNNATDLHPRNWLGYRGASAAQTLMEGFGLAAPLIVLPLAALGLHIAGGYSPLRLRQRLIFWTSALLTAPGFFASLPIPARWLLGTGLGGIFGDFTAGRMAKLSPPIPQPLLWPASALLFFVLGAWCVWRACGLKVQDLALAFEPLAGQAGSQPREVAFTDRPDASDLSKRFTSWAKRLSPRHRMAVQAEGPREFWMQEEKSAAVRDDPSYEGASPFSDWGGGFAGARAGRRETSKRAAAAERLASLVPARLRENETKNEDRGSENTYDDVRIEPFFGPSAEPPSSEGAPGSGRNPPPSPFLRLTGSATKAASAGAQRILASLAQGVKFRTPIIFIKDKPPGDPLVHRAGYSRPGAPAMPLPPLSLLAPATGLPRHKDSVDPAAMERAGSLLAVLEDFGVKGRFTGIYPGPVITLFELEPARGTNWSRVSGLADDIARAMGAPSARIAAIPGRDGIGIELPNPKPEMVSFRSIIEAQAFQNSPAALPLALGRSIAGEPVIADLARLPHLLIGDAAGAGGPGIGPIMLSLLFRLPPSQCNLIMIGAEGSGLSVYDGLPHLIAPVAASPQKAAGALKWAVCEMNSRHERMNKAGVENIASYNSNVAAAQLRGELLRRRVQTGFHPVTGKPIEEEETFDPVPMPYLVIVASEIAVLMNHAKKDMEIAVQRLAQMGHEAGIHLVMATQRPSMIADKVKACIQSRICFQVSSKIESRAVLGEPGAEQLLDAGDMLYRAGGGRISRVHGACVQDSEVEAAVRYWKAQDFPFHRGDIPEERSGAGFGRGERLHPGAYDAA